MKNECPSEEQAVSEREPRKNPPSPEHKPPQGGPPMHDGLEQVRDSHT
ncbi:MAG: hypothetical protein V7632_4711 [Bradyrhizobium sp.]